MDNLYQPPTASNNTPITKDENLIPIAKTQKHLNIAILGYLGSLALVFLGNQVPIFMMIGGLALMGVMLYAAVSIFLLARFTLHDKNHSICTSDSLLIHR